jgi:hypothetical protein
VKRFALHAGRPVTTISFDERAEFFASACGEPYISVRLALVVLVCVLVLGERRRRTHRRMQGGLKGMQ